MGTTKVEDLRNRGVEEVAERVQVLRDTTGRKIKKKDPVTSKHYSVQGVWNPTVVTSSVKVTL
jgi:hypothetical protein